MEKKRLLFVVLIIFVLFNVIAFVIPSEFSASFWVTYVFSVFALAFNGYMWSAFFIKDLKQKSKFYRIPLLHISFIYLGIQSVLFILFKFIVTPTWISIVLCVTLLTWALIGLITVGGSKEYIESVDNKIKTKVTFIKSLQMEVELIEQKSNNVEAKTRLKELGDKIKYSDPISDESLSDIENEILVSVRSLNSADELTIVNSVPDILLKIDERNKKCKLLKLQ